MSDIAFNMSAQPDEVVRAYAQIVESQKKVTDGAKQITATSKESADELIRMGSAGKAAGDIASAGLEGIKSAAGGVTAALAVMGDMAIRQLEKMQAKTANFREEVNTLKRALGQTGEAALLPEIEAQIAGIKSNVLDHKQLAGVFAEAHKAGKGMVGTDVEMTAVKEGALAASGGADASTFAKMFVELKKNLFKDASTEETSDQVVRLMKATPEGLDSGMLKYMNRASAAGVDSETIMQDVIKGSRSEEGAKALNKVLDESTKTIDVEGVEKKRSLEKRKDAIEDEIQGLERERKQVEKDKLSGAALPGYSQKEIGRGYDLRAREIGEQIDAKREEQRGVSKEIGSMHVSDVTDAELARMKKLAAIAPEDRYAAMMADPDKMSDSGRAALKSIRELSDADSATGQMGGMLAGAAHARNTSPRMAMLERIRAQEVATSNRKTDAKFSDLRATAEMAAEEEFIATQKGFKGSAGRFIKSIPGLDSEMRAMMAMKVDGGAAGADQNAEEASAVLKEQRDRLDILVGNTTKKGNDVSREGGNE